MGGARLLPPTRSVPITPSLIRYPATAERTAHLVLPFSFLYFSVSVYDLWIIFWLTWTVDVYTGFNISVTHFCLFLASYFWFRMASNEMRRCPDNGGRPCSTYMSPLFRDPHPTCTRCRGRSCSYNSTCNTCDGWLLDQWEHYRLTGKRAYAGRSKSSSRHAGDPIDSASNSPLSPASTRSVSPSPPSLPLSAPSEGMGEGSEAPIVTNISAVNVDEPRVPSPSSMPSREHEERGRDTSRVRDGEGEASSTYLALAVGWGGDLPSLSRTP